MSEEEKKVSDELFKDVKFYVVGDIDQKVVQLLKAGKGKEVSYNALATHIIAEDGDNPEVGESREVFDLPVVKPSWVILSVRCGDLLPVTGFSPESGQIFFGVTACLPRVSLPDDLNTLWAYITFYGGECQLNLNKKVTHLVVKEPKGAKFECALKHPNIKIVTLDWITDSVKDKSRKDEALYHPRLIYVEPEEEEESEAESYDRHFQSDGSYSPRRSRLSSGGSSGEESSPRRRPGPKRLNSVSPTSPRKPERRSERMFDDSDDDSPTEKEGTNLNWTPAEVVPPTPPIPTGTARRRVGPPGSKDPVSSTASGLINLCATAPPVPGSGGAMPVEARSGIPGWTPAVRTLRNITNNSDMQPTNRPANVAHIIQNLAANQTKPLEQQTNQSHPQTPNSTNSLLFNQSKLAGQPLTAEQQQQLLQQQHQVSQQQHQQLPQQPQHPMMQLQQQQHQMMQLQHQQQQQSQGAQQQGFPQLPQQQQQFLQQQQQLHQQQMFSQQQQQHAFSQQQLRPQQLLRPGLQQLQQQQALQQQLQQFQQQQRMQMLQQQQQQQQNQQQMHQQHLQQQHFLQQQQHMQQMQKQHMQNQQQQQALQHQSQQALQQQQQHQQQQQQQQTTITLQPQLQQPPHISHINPVLIVVPQDGFLLGCVFAVADYPEQMADKQLLATWKRALREGKRCVTAHWLNTVLKRKRMVPPHRTLHLPFAFPPGSKPCSHHIISVTGFVDADRDDLKLMAYLAGARYTGYLCRSNTVLICKEPSGLKYEKAKEWKIPCVNAQWLCDILLGNFEALRQIQHSRYSIYTHPEPLVPNPQLVQNLLAAWRTPIKVSPEALAVSFLKAEFCMCVCRLEEIQSPSKKLPPESTPRVMFTGFEPMQVQQYTKVKLHALGGEVADSSLKATHLVASKVTRTVKFLTAMSVVKHIISPEWLEESWRSQKFVDEQSYTLRDAEAEVLFGFSLEESLKRAHSAPLFKGKYFYLTPGICPSLSTMKSILESAGGKLLAKQPSYRKIMEHKQNKNLPDIILISCDNDLHLCREYFLKNIDVHNAEFILTGVLTQKLDYDSYPLQKYTCDHCNAN
uniref:PAX-interacting protein 1 n=1 Tax=Amphiprion ocellaris TaxID=80972 RepID=A0A3Q1DF99_AMPOC